MLLCPDTLLYEGDQYVWSQERVAVAWAECYRQLQESLKTGEILEVILLVGLPGAGKSTWLSKQAERLNGRVYFDATLCKTHRRAEVLAVIREVSQVPVSVVWLDTPLETCLERNSRRSEDRRVPEDKVMEMHRALRGTPPKWQEGFYPITIIRP